MKKTNINDLIVSNKGFIDNANDFKFEDCQGIGFEFNGRESFYGYYDCINDIVNYIEKHLYSLNIYTIDGYELERVSIEIKRYEVKLIL